MGDAAKERQTLQMAQRMRKADSDQDTYYMIDALMGDSSKLIECADSMMHERPKDPSMCLTLANAFAILKDKTHTMQMLKRFYDLGEYAMKMPRINERYSFLQGDPEFEAMMAHYDSLRVAALEELHARLGERDTLQGVTELPFTREGGVCRVKCTLNGLPLYFVFDTGASDVTISMVEATFMMKNGYLSGNDVVGSQRYMDANGDVTVGTVVNLRNVNFGGLDLDNVKASVVRNQKAPLLLGQSVLGRLGKIEIDNSKNVLKISKNNY
jgi:clan AA aspartic protease (TIGR02281 family)